MRRSRLLLLLVVSLLLPGPALAEGPNRVGLVVQYADGHVDTQCLAFPEQELSGEEVLRRSGLSLILDYSTGIGAGVCKIGGDGCDLSRGEECFCQCQGLNCRYWAYFEGKEDGSWTYLGVGPTGHTVHNGSLEGWAWTKGTMQEEAETMPPQVTFAEVCAASAEQSTKAGLPLTPTLSPPGRGERGTQSQGAVAFVSLVALLGVAGVAVVWRRRGRA
jgi:hypothetical protein